MLSCHETVSAADVVFVIVTPAVRVGPPTVPEYCRLPGEMEIPAVVDAVACCGSERSAQPMVMLMRQR